METEEIVMQKWQSDQINNDTILFGALHVVLNAILNEKPAIVVTHRKSWFE